MAGLLDGVRVLIVDDDRDVLDSFNAAFIAEGAETQAVEDGNAAVASAWQWRAPSRFIRGEVEHAQQSWRFGQQPSPILDRVLSRQRCKLIDETFGGESPRSCGSRSRGRPAPWPCPASGRPLQSSPRAPPAAPRAACPNMSGWGEETERSNQRTSKVRPSRNL